MTLPPLLGWLARTPPAFGGDAHLPAVIADLFETLTGAPPPRSFVDAFRRPDPRHRAWALYAAHLWWYPDLRAGRPAAAPLQALFLQELATLAAVADPAGVPQDPERQEELVRRSLRAAGIRLEGESEADAADRLKQVDSVERHRVLKAAGEREKRAREVREAMAKQAAEEAAAKVTRE